MPDKIDGKKITFNNAYGNKNDPKKIKVRIQNNWSIMNYKEEEEKALQPKGAGKFKVSVFDGNKVKYEKGENTISTGDVKLNSTKFNILEAIIKMVDDDGKKGKENILSVNDLIEAREDFKNNNKKWKKLKVKNFKLDKDSGIATIIIDGSNGEEILRFKFKKEDISKKKEKNNSNSHKIVSGDTLGELAQKYDTTITEIKKANPGLQGDKLKIGYELNIPTSADKKSANTQSTSKTSKKSKTKLTNEVAKVISTFKGGKIDISEVKDFKTVAQYTGLSVDYIRDILVGIEGRNNWPVCVAEYDGVPGPGHPKGHLTIGFGHTSLIGEPKVKEGMTITNEQAYQILANDIITLIGQVKTIIKRESKENLYDKSPKSIKDALIDLAFNKGAGKVADASIIANLKAGSYGATARRTWYDTKQVGLMKRNMYRFLLAIRDISSSEKRGAIKKFRSEHFDDLIKVFNADSQAKVAWNKACEDYNLKKYKF